MEWRERVRTQVRRLRRQVRNQAAPVPAGPSAPAAPAAPSKGGFPARYRSLLPTAKPRRVVILGDFETRELVTKLLADFAEDDVHVMSSYSLPEWELEARGVDHQPMQRPSQVVWHLRLLGPVDVLINCFPADEADQQAMWDKTFLHLKHRGVYALSTRALDADARTGLVRRWVDGQVATPHIREDAASSRQDELDHAIQGVAIDTDWLMVLKGGHHCGRTTSRGC